MIYISCSADAIEPPPDLRPAGVGGIVVGNWKKLLKNKIIYDLNEGL
jgi:hypothetical protein